MNTMPIRLPTVMLAVSPPGSSQTATASARMIATLRMCVLRSGPTTVHDTSLCEPSAPGDDRRERVADVRPLRSGRSGSRRRGLVRPVDRLTREPVPDPEVRVDVAPPGRRALELLAQLAYEDVNRPVAVDHRVAPHALVDLLALEHLSLGVGQQLDQLELAAREVDRLVAGERLELVGPDLDLADRHRLGDRPRLGPLAAPHDRLHTGDQLLRVARLGHPVVGAHPQPADALGHARLAGADHNAELREPRA